jgi:hypothetical protein
MAFRGHQREPDEHVALALKLPHHGKEIAMMRVTIGLIALGVVGGVVPTGLPGVTQAAQVLAGTAGALLTLIVCCLAGAAASRAASSAMASAPRLQRSRIATTQSASRSTI